MKTKKVLAWVICLASMLATPLVRAQEAATPGVEERPVRASFDIRWESSFSEVGAAVQEVLGRGPSVFGGVPQTPISDKFHINSWNNRSGATQIELTATIADRKAAVEAIRALAKRIEDEMKARHQEALKERQAELQKHKKQLDEADDAVRAVDHELSAMRSQLRKVAKRVDVSREGISAAATSLEQEAQKIAIELRALEARKQAMEKAIVMITKRAGEDAKKDPILAELEALVAARERELKQIEMMHQQGLTSLAEMENTRTKLAEGKIRLLERREATSRGGGADTAKGLNDSLLMMSIDLAEQQARLEAVRETLTRFEEASGMLDQMDRCMRERQQRLEKLTQANANMGIAEREVAGFRPPTISVRGLDERPAPAGR